MRGLSLWCKAYLFLTAFSILGTLLTRFTGVEPGWIAPAAAFLTLLCGTAAVYEPFVSELGWKTGLRSLLLIACGGLCAEFAGVMTYLPFGRYEYTDRWWPAFRVPFWPETTYFPLCMPLAWAMMVGASYGLASRFRLSFWATAFLGAAFAALADLLMEPVMVDKLHYWRWIDKGPLPGSAPISNLLAWFGVSFLVLVVVTWQFLRPTSRPEPAIVYVAHLAMTLVFWMALP